MGDHDYFVNFECCNSRPMTRRCVTSKSKWVKLELLVCYCNMAMMIDYDEEKCGCQNNVQPTMEATSEVELRGDSHS